MKITLWKKSVLAGCSRLLISYLRSCNTMQSPRKTFASCLFSVLRISHFPCLNFQKKRLNFSALELNFSPSTATCERKNAVLLHINTFRSKVKTLSCSVHLYWTALRLQKKRGIWMVLRQRVTNGGLRRRLPQTPIVIVYLVSEPT